MKKARLDAGDLAWRIRMTEEVSFYRDALKSYMVIRCPSGTGGEGYQYRMLAANHIDGLLDCSFRNIDADSYLYYDITSRQKLSVLFTARTMSAEDVRRILQDVVAVRQNLADFLLDSSRMIMDPDFIFCDLCDGACAFTYYPENTDESGVRSLLEFMGNHIDEQDGEASGIVYRLLSMAENDGFSLNREMLDTVSEQNDADRERPAGSSDCNFSYNSPTFDPASSDPLSSFTDTAKETVSTNGRDDDISRSDQKDVPDEYASYTKTASAADKPAASRTGKITTVFGIACIILGVVLYGISDWYPVWIMGGTAAALCRAAIFIFPAFGVLLIVAGRFRKRKKHGIDSERGEQHRSEYEEGNPIFPSEYPEAFQMKAEKNDFACDMPQEHTTVLKRGTGTRGKLYGIGKARGMQISLDQLPCTIGKMREYANIVLNDSSVSRMHAALSAGEDGQIYIKDLNSTNGTDVNGVGLCPDESAAIRPGDEIRIGGLSFIYR